MPTATALVPVSSTLVIVLVLSGEMVWLLKALSMVDCNVFGFSSSPLRVRFSSLLFQMYLVKPVSGAVMSPILRLGASATAVTLTVAVA